MNKAKYIGTVPLGFIDNSQTSWIPEKVDDIIRVGYISEPKGYLFTMGSGVHSTMTSFATYPNYWLPANSQYYIAGRDVMRWAGTANPTEIDIDRYGFTPDFKKQSAVVWMAPKTEPHHLSARKEMLDYMPEDWKEFCKAVLNGEFS